MTDYNGWTNYETWNVNLWIDNQEPLYRDKVRFLRRATHIDGSAVKGFVLDMLPDGTPDFDSVRDYERVNWAEIAEHWETEAEELNG